MIRMTLIQKIPNQNSLFPPQSSLLAVSMWSDMHSMITFSSLRNGLLVSTPSAVMGSVSAFSNCHFHVVPSRDPGGAADEKIELSL